MRILQRAEELSHECNSSYRPSNKVLGLLFFQPSTRTHFGFHAAIARLGGTGISLCERRYESAMSRAESPVDTVRSVSAYCDALVLRHGEPSVFKQAMDAAEVPVINGGCGADRHPTQALIDLYAIRSSIGRLEGLHVGLAGDLATSRAARSLIRALTYFSPAELRLMLPAERPILAPELERFSGRVVRSLDYLDLTDLDVLYMAGFPEGVGNMKVSDRVRSQFRLTLARARKLCDRTSLLCPLPRIDEIAEAVDSLPQSRYFEQSAQGLFVRMALLEWSLNLVPSSNFSGDRRVLTCSKMASSGPVASRSDRIRFQSI